MGIVAEDIEEVKAKIDFLAVVEAHTKMKRVGHQYVGRCPFHEERTGSFCVNLEKGVYLCRGCQAAGDVITFVQESQHLDFVGAVETLAARAGVTLRYDDSDQSDRKSRKKTVLDLLAAVTEHYHGLLLTADEAKAARAYLRDRDFSSDTVRAWKLGYAPASRSEAWDAFRERTPWEIWEAAGLGYRDAGGATHDHFQDRVLFPIRDLAGNVIGFGGRVLPGAKDNRKYVNSPNGLVYQKSEALFGISVAKKAIVTKGAAIITEGYTDVTSLHAAGFDNAVAGCGTALTEEHLGVLCRFSKNVIAFYDSDSAGQEATAKVATHAAQLGIDLRVVVAPNGMDPDEWSRTDPETLAEAIAEPMPIMRWQLNRVLATLVDDTVEQRVKTAHDATHLVATHPDRMVRKRYLTDVSQSLRIPLEELEAEADSAVPAPVLRLKKYSHEAKAGPLGVPNSEAKLLRAAAAVEQWPEAWPTPAILASPLAARALAALLDKVPLDVDDPANTLYHTALIADKVSFSPVAAIVGWLLEVEQRECAVIERVARKSDDPDAWLPLLKWVEERREELHSSDEAVRDDAIAVMVEWVADRRAEADAMAAQAAAEAAAEAGEAARAAAGPGLAPQAEVVPGTEQAPVEGQDEPLYEPATA